MRNLTMKTLFTELFILSLVWWGTVSLVAAEVTADDAKPGGGPALARYVSAGELSGQMTIAGSDTMQPMVSKLTAAFKRFYPQVDFAVEGGGSEEGIRGFILGYSDQRRGDKARQGHLGPNKPTILSSSRKLREDELRAFASHRGYRPMEFPIAMDAVALFVNRENPIHGLTLEQVDAIFSHARKRGYRENIATWGQLGLTDGWEDQPIRLYGRDKASGTREFFTQAALLGADLKEEVKEQPGSASEILAIARDPLGMGYLGIGFQSSYVKAVPLAERAGLPYVSPTPETVADGTYPLSRLLYFYVDQPPGKPYNPTLLEFLRFINSQDGQVVVARAQYFPLSPSLVNRSLVVLNGEPVSAALPVAKD